MDQHACVQVLLKNVCVVEEKCTGMLVQADPVVRALADLFATFEAERQRGSGRQVVAPSSLREALHSLDPRKFCIGAPAAPPVHHLKAVPKGALRLPAR